MRYAQIRKLDISNGEGIGIALFVQGCHFHCKNCFNQTTWNFNGGKSFTTDVKKHFLNLAKNKYVSRVSILGGEPLAAENYLEVEQLCRSIDKPIWLYTGYTFNKIPCKSILEFVDIIVDGQYVDDLKDFSLKFRGSSNQHIWKKDKDNHWYKEE